jgi:pullulanase
VIELDFDWHGDSLPVLVPGDKAFAFASLEPADPSLYADEAAYYVDDEGNLVFVLDPELHTWIDYEEMPVYVAGTFNGWEEAVGQAEWCLHRGELNGREVWMLRKPAELFFSEPPQQFKFITGDNRWIDLPNDATNLVSDGSDHFNWAIFPERTGRNLFTFTTQRPVQLNQAYSVTLLQAGQPAPRVRVRLGKFFHEMRSELPLGAIVKRGVTTFRIFVPRAKYVRLFITDQLDDLSKAFGYELDRRDEDGRWNGVWEANVDRNLHGWYYWYSLSGPPGVFSHFFPNQKILDPYAQAVVGREGPAIVIDAMLAGKADRSFKTPAWQDLIIAEAHVRDLAALAPVPLTDDERLGFAGLTKWVNSPEFYLKKLGVNAVELQPIHEFDNKTRGEYHWGYMTVNFFSPASAYASDGAKGTQVRELQELVAAFHRQGMAVIIDVVYNHVGEPAHLLFLDKLYYLELDEMSGDLENWSGCGNDVRARSAMVTRLIIDSLVHLIEVYGVDGFRFDLAELIGVDVLRKVETAVKKVKPDVILIAEPWSFRGHITAALRPTGYASWNDGYRNFVRSYVHGNGDTEKLEYFLKGSPWHFAYWPAQTVNYTESHDDRTWIDGITENAEFNGFNPTFNDRRRTHLMAAILFSSVGIPMISAGQDFMRSKHGVNNTYLRGDLNALDYRRAAKFSGTHAYFAAWIAFRRSAKGALLRQWSRVTEGFFHCITQPGWPALVAIYNADQSRGTTCLMFAINPHTEDMTMQLGDYGTWKWRLVADHEKFYADGEHPVGHTVNSEVFIPGLGCSLWVVER